VDHKTAGAAYDDHESEMSDQLNAYKLAEPEVENIALWVFVKSKEPKNRVVSEQTNFGITHRVSFEVGLRRAGNQQQPFLQTAGHVVLVLCVLTSVFRGQQKDQ